MKHITNLTLRLLGSPTLEADGRRLSLGRRKAEALLAYLALLPQSHNREALAAIFWPELDQRAGRADLSRTLSVLKKVLGGDKWLEADRDTISLKVKVGDAVQSDLPATTKKPTFWVDVLHFQNLLRMTEQHRHPPDHVCDECLPYLCEAAALYRDDFLAGL